MLTLDSSKMNTIKSTIDNAIVAEQTSVDVNMNDFNSYLGIDLDLSTSIQMESDLINFNMMTKNACIELIKYLQSQFPNKEIILRLKESDQTTGLGVRSVCWNVEINFVEN